MMFDEMELTAWKKKFPPISFRVTYSGDQEREKYLGLFRDIRDGLRDRGWEAQITEKVQSSREVM